MIKLIEKLLKENKEVSAYLINYNKSESVELFYVLKNLEMNRATEFVDCSVTVYKDFENYRGSQTFNINSSNTENEIKEKIKTALYACSFVTNPYFELPKQFNYTNNTDFGNLKDSAKFIVDAIFSQDVYQSGWINSTEIFIKKNNIQIINSNGVNANYDTYKLNIEIIPTWKNGEDEVELYKMIEHGSLDVERISSEVNEILTLSKYRSEAISLNEKVNCKVILKDKEVFRIFRTLANDLDYSNIYRKMNLLELNKKVFEDDSLSDPIDILLTPNLTGSTNNRPVDSDGVILNDIKVIENGVCVNSHGSNRFGYYLNIEKPTGIIPNLVCKCGSKSFEEMQKEPYILCESFSGMQIDLNSGFYGGEVRLGFYFDGTKTTPITGFSISGNLNDPNKQFKFSKEEVILNSYKGPKYLEIKGVKIL